jgi:hypothetical protein
LPSVSLWQSFSIPLFILLVLPKKEKAVKTAQFLLTISYEKPDTKIGAAHPLTFPRFVKPSFFPVNAAIFPVLTNA